MTVADYAFYAFAIVTVAAGLMVTISRNPVHSVLWLILAFLSSAGLFVLLGAEFVAMLLIIVYVGAVAVLFLFVVMMLDINLDRLREGFWSALPVALPVGGLMAVEMVMIVGVRNFGVDKVAAPAPHPADYSNTAELGRVLYTDYLLPFELASVVLLVAIIAAIALTLRDRKDSKSMDPSKQVLVKKADRIRIVKMQAEVETPVAADSTEENK